jgi:hypothetical protein
MQLEIKSSVDQNSRISIDDVAVDRTIGLKVNHTHRQQVETPAASTRHRLMDMKEIAFDQFSTYNLCVLASTTCSITWAAKDYR